MILKDDIFTIKVPYNLPPYGHIAYAFKLTKVDHLDKPYEPFLTIPRFFEDYSNPMDVTKFAWPDLSLYLEREESRRRIMYAPNDRFKMRISWSVHFRLLRWSKLK